MKVSKGDSFEPITILIETEDEAKKMWCGLNSPTATIIATAKRWGFKLIHPDTIEMFDAFNAVFDPTE